MKTKEEILELTYRDKWEDAFPNDIAMDRAIKLVKVCEEWTICTDAMQEFAEAYHQEMRELEKKKDEILQK